MFLSEEDLLAFGKLTLFSWQIIAHYTTDTGDQKQSILLTSGWLVIPSSFPLMLTVMTAAVCVNVQSLFQSAEQLSFVSNT